MSEWQPIETAPKDGTLILMHDGSRDLPFVVHWGHVGRFTTSPKMWLGHQFGAMECNKHYQWMPLPPPPNPL